MGLHDLAVLHHEAELVDDGAVVHQGHGGVHHAVDAGLQGRGKQLLRGDVGDILLAGQGDIVARLPDVTLGQFHRQIGAKRVCIMQGFEVQGVQLLHPLMEGGEVVFPLLHRFAVAADADGLENGVPQLFHGFVFAILREHGLRPAGDGNGGDAPGEAAAHLQAVKVLQRLAAGLLGADDALGVHALEIFRVGGGDGEIRRALQGVVVEEVAAPQGHLVKDLVIGLEVLHPGHGVVVPVHDHFLAAGVVGLLGAHPGEPGALHRRGNHQALALLDIQSHPHQEAGVFPQFFIHDWSSLPVFSL